MCTHAETHMYTHSSQTVTCPQMHTSPASASFGWIWVLVVLFLPSLEAELPSPEGTQQGRASCPVNFLWLWALESCTLCLIQRLGLYLRSRASRGGGALGWRMESPP